MKLERWAHASEIFGAIAIVISLVILIFEVRNNTAIQQQQMQIDRALNFTDTFLNAPHLADIYAKVKAVDGIEPLAGAYVERYSLTPAEAVLWSRMVQRTLFTWQAQYLFSGPTEDLESEIRNVFKYVDLQMAYDINEDELLGPEFIEYVNSIVGRR
jgi:hypothetical protein